MSLSTNQLWQRITAAGLASPMQCRAWATEVTANLSATEAADVQRISAALVAQGKLTAFQANTILSGSDQPLVLDGWRILEPVAGPKLTDPKLTDPKIPSPEHAPPDARCVWANWWLATKSPTSPSPTSPMHWVRWLASDELKSEAVAGAQPSLPQVLRHSQIKSPLMQRVDAPEMSNGRLRLSVEPVSGRLLSSWCDGKPRPLATVWRMLIDVAGSLAALHAAGLAHGRVTPDRILVSDDGRCRLMRDPLCGLTMSISDSGSGLLAQQLPAKLNSAHFMAPEFLATPDTASPATDCYGLGAIAWLLLVGQPPLTARSAEKILAAHAQQPLDTSLLADQPEPVVHCLVHCLAKNPSARFPSATALLRAAEEVSRILAQGKVHRAQPPAANAAQPKAIPEPKVHRRVETVVQAERVTDVESVKADLSEPQVAQASDGAVISQVVDTPNTIKPAAQLAAEQKPTSEKSTAQKSPAQKSTSQKNESNVAAAVSKPSTTAAESAPVASAPVASAPVASAPVASAPVASAPVGSEPVTPVVRRPVRRPVVKRKRTNPWLTPIIGGGGVVVLLLVLLLFRGGTSSNAANKKTATAPQATGDSPSNSGNTKNATASGSANASAAAAAAAAVADPRGQMFELVENNPQLLWAPPRVPQPLTLDLLPPGGQIFIALRPRDLLTHSDQQSLLKLLEPDLQTLWQWVRERSGVEPTQISELVIAGYSGAGGVPQYAARIELAMPQSASDLKTAWKNPSETKQGGDTLWTSGPSSYFFASGADARSSSIERFSVGPTELMQDVVAARGAAGPLPTALERLIQATDRQSQLNVLIVPSFLFTDGRQLLNAAPPRAADITTSWLQRDMRGASLSIDLQDDGFYELRLIGASDRDATPNQQRLREALSKLPQQVESWLVDAVPHAYWRAVAMRYPNMLRVLSSQTRTGVESGQAIANGYLPSSAMQNIVYATWMAVQPGSTSGSEVAVGVGAAPVPALTADQILERPISLVVDQQGIEVVLQLIGEQANEKLPAGTRPLKFELDGSGFQRAGFTRNQQVKNFKIEGQSVRAALTELARRQNPVPGVQDLKSAEQKMVWLLVNGDKPEAAQVSLTSREAATTAGLKLPGEFAQ